MTPIPDDILIAVALRQMPLAVFADWLGDRSHPWEDGVRALGEGKLWVTKFYLSNLEVAAVRGDVMQLVNAKVPFRGGHLDVESDALKRWGLVTQTLNVNDFFQWLGYELERGFPKQFRPRMESSGRLVIERNPDWTDPMRRSRVRQLAPGEGVALDNIRAGDWIEIVQGASE